MMLDICDEFVRSGIRTAPLNRGNTVLLKHLEKIIQDVTGHHDKRAIKNHMKDLIRYQYLKDEGYVGAFLILNTGTDLEEIERVMEQQKQEEKKEQKQQLQEQEKQNQKEFDDMIEGRDIK